MFKHVYKRNLKFNKDQNCVLILFIEKQVYHIFIENEKMKVDNDIETKNLLTLLLNCTFILARYTCTHFYNR